MPTRPGGQQARHASTAESGTAANGVTTPSSWRRTASAGPGRHVTSQTFVLPDGERREWNSRWARKGLGMRNPDEPHRCGVFSWRPRTLSWWVAVLFTLGSVLFVLGGTGAIAGWEATRWLNFAGSILFSVGTYLQLLEVVNRPTRAEGGKGELARPGDNRFRWISADFSRVDYRAVLIQFGGALFFQVNTFFALFEASEWYIEELLVWAPSVIGSVGFVWSSYLFLAEAGNGYLKWNWGDIGWRAMLWTLVGSTAFLVASFLGFFGAPPAPFNPVGATNLIFLIGSGLFLVGSYISLRELSWRPLGRSEPASPATAAVSSG